MDLSHKCGGGAAFTVMGAGHRRGSGGFWVPLNDSRKTVSVEPSRPRNRWESLVCVLETGQTLTFDLPNISAEDPRS